MIDGPDLRFAIKHLSIRGAYAVVARKKARRPDIIVEDHGSVALLRGMTDAGYNWIEEHVSTEGFQPFGLGARLAEPRYVPAVIDGARADGLVVR